MASSEQRLFFALWPESSARKRASAIVEELKASMRGRWCEPGNLHITLAFLGAADAERAIAAKRAADAASGSPFEISLDRVELWRKPGILCLTPAQPPEALILLAESLSAELRASGFALENRAYRPHLTLAREARHLPASSPSTGIDRPGEETGKDRLRLSPPVIWAASRFVLAESVATPKGTEYRLVSSWPLSAPG